MAKLSEIKKIVKIVYALNQEGKYLAVMIWGPPGVGKSAAIKQATEELGIGFIDLRLSLLNPVDLRGLPTIDRRRHKAEWLEPDFLPNGDNGDAGILFLDEINLAPQSVLSAGYQLILDRALGNYRLPQGWIVVAAGNRGEDNSAITRFPAPLANRFIHLEIDQPDLEEWRTWAIQAEIAEQIVAFLGKMPQHLYVQPKTGERAYPTPRSWEFSSNLFKAGERIDMAVGEGVASEFYSFLDIYKEIPDVEAILRGESVPIPEKLDVLWALSLALVYRTEVKNLAPVFAYLSKLGEKFKEFEVLTILSLAKKSDVLRAAITQSQEWHDWIEKNRALVDSTKDF